MSAFRQQHEPEPVITHPNDETLGGNFLDIGHIRDPKHRQFIRALSTHIDENKEKFKKHLEFVEYDPSSRTRNIIYSPFDPQFKNTELIVKDSFLYSLSSVAVIVCFDPQFNENIGLLTDEKNQEIWRATVDGETKIALKLQNKDHIEGVGITINASTQRDYLITVSFINEDNHVVSQIFQKKSSSRTNLKQFLILENPVDGINRITVELKELTTDAKSVYNLKNISVFNYVNNDLLRSMGDNNIIEYDEINNPVFLKEAVAIEPDPTNNI